jgi:hypothetical protein
MSLNKEKRRKTLRLVISSRKVGVGFSQKRNKKESISKERKAKRNNSESISQDIHKNVKKNVKQMFKPRCINFE